MYIKVTNLKVNLLEAPYRRGLSLTILSTGDVAAQKLGSDRGKIDQAKSGTALFWTFEKSFQRYIILFRVYFTL